MATFTQLPSGRWRVQIRRRGLYRAGTFRLKRDAESWSREIERQADYASAGSYAPPPKMATVSDLIDAYINDTAKDHGKTKTATLAMLKRQIGSTRLVHLNDLTLRDFVDRRAKAGAGGVTIAADLSYLGAVLKWGRHVRRLDLRPELAKEARQALPYRGLSTRGGERNREPSDDELQRLYALWKAKPRLRIDMQTICEFALATGMRLGEICRLEIEDINVEERTVLIRDRKDPRNKAGNNQRVPLLPAAWKIVERIMQEREFGYLFPVNADSVSTAFTRACHKAGITDLHFHDMRHRATAEFFRMGLDIPRVAVLTGHKTWEMLRRYTDIKPGDVHAALAPRQRKTKPAFHQTRQAAGPRVEA